MSFSWRWNMQRGTTKIPAGHQIYLAHEPSNSRRHVTCVGIWLLFRGHVTCVRTWLLFRGVYNAGATLNEHWVNALCLWPVFREGANPGWYSGSGVHDALPPHSVLEVHCVNWTTHPANIYWHFVGFMLGQRGIRCNNIGLMSCICCVATAREG